MKLLAVLFTGMALTLPSVKAHSVETDSLPDYVRMGEQDGRVPLKRFPALVSVHKHFLTTGADPRCFNMKVEFQKELYSGGVMYIDAMVVNITHNPEYLVNNVVGMERCGVSMRYLVTAGGDIVLLSPQK